MADRDPYTEPTATLEDVAVDDASDIWDFLAEQDAAQAGLASAPRSTEQKAAAQAKDTSLSGGPAAGVYEDGVSLGEQIAFGAELDDSVYLSSGHLARIDLRASLEAVLAAWAEVVPSGPEAVDDLRAVLSAGVAVLQEQMQQGLPTVPGMVARESTAVVDGVNAALREAGKDTAILRNVPQWLEIQTIRGAARHLWTTLAERSGECFDRLVGDRRVLEFLRDVSIVACERIARLAHQGADWLRRHQGPLPSAEALLAVGGAAGAYSASVRRQALPGAEALLAGAIAPPAVVEVPMLRKMGQALDRPGPDSVRVRKVSASAAKARSSWRLSKQPTTTSGEQPEHLRGSGPAPASGRSRQSR